MQCIRSMQYLSLLAGLVAMWALVPALLATPASAQLDDPSLPAGQLIVDPHDSRWLKRNGQGSLFIAGAGDPEDFLYRGALLPDGTRDGDQLTFIGQLAASGANALYLQAVRSHGDGGPTEDPWNVHGNPASGLNDALLDQWESWFDAMDAAGIVIYFFFYDDSCCVPFGGINRQVGAQEIAFVSALVDRFEHHDNLIWLIAEEYEEAHSPEVVQDLANVIRAADDRDHVIGVHQVDAIDFDFVGVQPIEHFSMQLPAASAPEQAYDEVHASVIAAQDLAQGQVQIMLAEAADHYDPAAPDRTFTRRYSWAAAMAGATVTVYLFEPGMPQAILEDHGRMAAFLSSQKLTGLESHDELARLGTDWVLAAPDDRYLLYARNADASVGVSDVTPDFYTLHWLDVVNGAELEESPVWLQQEPVIARPPSIGRELAVSITRLPEPGGPAPLVSGALGLAALAQRARRG